MEIGAQASFSHILEMEHNDSLKPKIQLSLSSLRKTTRKLRKYYSCGYNINTNKIKLCAISRNLWLWSAFPFLLYSSHTVFVTNLALQNAKLKIDLHMHLDFTFSVNP